MAPVELPDELEDELKQAGVELLKWASVILMDAFKTYAHARLRAAQLGVTDSQLADSHMIMQRAISDPALPPPPPVPPSIDYHETLLSMVQFMDLLRSGSFQSTASVYTRDRRALATGEVWIVEYVVVRQSHESAFDTAGWSFIGTVKGLLDG